VPQLGKQPGFTPEALEEAWPCEQIWPNGLHSHSALKPRIPGSVHRAKATPPNEVLELITQAKRRLQVFGELCSRPDLPIRLA
jgi:hypothetical protein